MDDDAPSSGFAAIAFVVASLGWVLFNGLAAGVATVVLLGDPTLLQRPDGQDLVAAMPGSLLAASALVQAVGLGALALVMSRWLGGPSFGAPPARAVALGPSVAVGGFAALTIGLFPAWLWSVFAQWLPTQLDLLQRVLTDGDSLTRGLFVVAICVAAPIGEELAFRGFLWHHLERLTGSPGRTWLLTSVIFCAYHLDPLQALALLPTSFFLGWLRLWSRTLWAPIAGHTVNNLIATAQMLGFLTLPAPTLWLGLAGLLVTATVCGVGWRLERST